jgi:hypothetical protein
MQLPVPNPQKPRWLFLVFVFFFFSPSLSTAEGTLLCGSSKQDTSPNFIPNFTAAMKEVSKGISESKWASHSVIYLSGCYLRYDIHNFYNEAIDEDRDMVICRNPTYVHADQNFQREFTKRIRNIVRRAARNAVSDKGFAVEVEAGGSVAVPVYAMGQCWATQTTLNCSKCMLDAAKKVSKCAPATDGRVMNAGCYLRYSTDNFFSNDKEDELNERRGKTLTYQLF